jgi:hypothetical protein
VKLLAMAMALGASSMVLALLGQQPPPAQPLPFSHRMHAGTLGIGCTACHAYAEQGPVAGIPSVARCRGCHKFVKSDPAGDPSLNAELAQLSKKLDEGTTIEWVRVHRVPDHVYFTHRRHLRSGIDCRDCHGDIQTMETVRQVSPLNMGWCLDCHRRKQSERPAERAYLTECSTCHK